MIMAYASLATPQEWSAYQEMTKQPDSYEPLYDAQGNIVGQRNTKTGKVESDPRAVSDTLQEIYDPNSPTGTKFVPRSEAIGQPGKPSKELSITAPDGTVIQYGSGPGSGLEKRTAGEVQDKLLKAGDTMAQLTSIRAKFKPEFQQIGTRAGVAWSKLKDKINPDSLSPDERTTLDEYSQYKADAAQLFALTLKDLSGVAVNPTEFKRTEAWLPNPGSGILDGDSPQELKSKMDRFEDFTRKALMKYSYINRHGFNIDQVDLDDMPKLMNQRGTEIEKELTAKGLTGDELKRAVRMRLSDEFGLGAY